MELDLYPKRRVVVHGPLATGIKRDAKTTGFVEPVKEALVRDTHLCEPPTGWVLVTLMLPDASGPSFDDTAMVVMVVMVLLDLLCGGVNLSMTVESV